MSEIIKEENNIIVKPGEDIVASMTDKFKTELASLAQESSCDLTIDFSGVEMIDSIGIGVIVATHNFLRKDENKLKLININNNIFSHFKFLRLDRHIDIEKNSDI